MHFVLFLPASVRSELAALAGAGYPDETCGLLLGQSAADTCRVLAQRPARNLNRRRSRDRFEVDPADYLAAESTATASGLQLVGVWHSHPDHPARPSATDRAMAWAGWSYVIVAVNAGKVVDLRSWRLAADDFCEEEVRDD